MTETGPFASDAPLSPEDFDALAAARGLTPFRARKIAPVAARRLNEPTRIQTRWNGAETVKQAEAGSWLITSLDETGAPLRDGQGELNRYAIGAASFEASYAPGDIDGAFSTPYGRVFRPITEVDALLLEQGFDIVAPWGERQRADRGYLICTRGKVYGNHGDTFEATYRRV